jgi:hypothetical protein
MDAGELKELSSRPKWRLIAEGYTTKRAVRSGVVSGKIYPGFAPNYGLKGHAEVMGWLGYAPSLHGNQKAVNQYIEYLEKRGYTVIPPGAKT